MEGNESKETKEGKDQEIKTVRTELIVKPEEEEEKQEQGLVRVKEDAIDIDTKVFNQRLKDIKWFQKLCRSQMQEGKDYGEIPGTSKPTLLKPGAEKIAKLMGLEDDHVILKEKEDWDKPFFYYLVKCSLISLKTGRTISTGLGSCNSYESKYRYRWVFRNQLPVEYKDRIDELKTKIIQAKNGREYTMYQIENDDVFSQVNTFLKMAKKRAMVDACLSVGRLSDLYTQDLEDMDMQQKARHGSKAAPKRTFKKRRRNKKINHRRKKRNSKLGKRICDESLQDKQRA